MSYALKFNILRIRSSFKSPTPKVLGNSDACFSKHYQLKYNYFIFAIDRLRIQGLSETAIELYIKTAQGFRNLILSEP